MDKYIRDMEKGTAAESDYKELSEGEVSQTGSTMVLLAVALGLSDQDNKYKAQAGALVAACQKLAAAKDYAATKKAVAGVVAAAKEGQPSGEVKWARLADLKDLMKQVPRVNTKLKSNLNHLGTKAKEAAANVATLAVIAQGAMADVADTRKPAESQKWFVFSTEMREAAAAVNASIRVKNQKAVEESMDRLQKSCDDCHAVFKEEEKKPDK
jgi:cytochrome c556